MKFQIILVLCLLAVALGGKIKDTQDAKSPQWPCPKVSKFNNDAHDDRADSTKCSYLTYLRQQLLVDYQEPQYPLCYAQIDNFCSDKIANYVERGNIRTFVTALTILCNDGKGWWDEFVELLHEFQDKHAEAFSTEYWQCIEDKANEFVEAEYVPLPTFPFPWLDVLNYVCPNTFATIKNADRQAYADFHDANKGFANLQELEKSGRNLFEYVSETFANSDLSDDIKNCMTEEIGYFMEHIIPEQTNSRNAHSGEEEGWSQAYLDRIGFGDGEQYFNAYVSLDGIACWNYFSPQKHYHETTNSIPENAFDGNRGHPLCPDNTMFQPVTIFGPMCCPIHPSTEKPKTYDCCQESKYQYQLEQVRWRNGNIRKTIPLKSSESCYGCTCLKGWEMDASTQVYFRNTHVQTYRYGGGEKLRGSCVLKHQKNQDEGEE